MEKPSGVKEFFDISDKLSAPAKKSLRERQKEEAEAKRKREEEEAKAALKDFQRSLGVEEDDDGERPHDSGTSRIGTARHFVPRGPRGNSGPGSLGPPPPSLSRKRGFDGSHKDQGLLAYSNSGPLDAATAFRDSDDEDERAANLKNAEKAVPKPTMRLSSLPPSITAAQIRNMIPSTLTVEAVNISSNIDARSGDRKSTSAIVTLAHSTPAKDIDAVVNTLEKRYLGFGFHLSISRHLSSSSLDTPAPGLAGATPASLPFGAKSIPGAAGQSMSRAPPPPSLRGIQQFPQSYGSSQAQFGRYSLPTQITVKPPSDIKQLKLINKTIETLLNNGPEFEALLMSRPEVQRDQKWEWLWNARSPAGVWYRWKLWQTITGEETDPTTRSRFKVLEQKLFYDSAPWIAPDQPLPFEFITRFEEFVSDPEYDSSDEEASDDDAPRRQQHVSGGPPEANFDTDDALKSYLNPLKKSKLTHLLARLPTSTARLRRGDVARVSAFAISHADKGADEIVNMLVTNIFKPFALSSANPDRQKQEDEAEQDENGEKKAEREDPSSAKLIGIYVISDIFASCGTSGVRQAWRYREWFEAAFRKRHLFEHLGRLEKDLQWGRLRAEKWKRSINNILSVWDTGNVFSPSAHAHFVEVFNNPPLTEAERRAAEKADQEAARAAAKSKWKTVEVKAEAKREESKVSSPGSGAASKNDDVDGELMAEDVDGEPMGNGDIDGEPMDEDVDGEPMEDVKGGEAGDDLDGEPMEEEKASGKCDYTMRSEPEGSSEAAGQTEAAKARRRRPKAEDMFADSEDE
ncbi:SWAP/Surp [Macrophomina phaseolina MS6]|uniref:SWAP/Surp n=1 Tax=Macrophomina phaseolina (strain MS6) TaxID=1126212 RepID=K2RCJ2_MACPH|nr:SWAP/Surp [Macrophomina phaseolina MS6]